MFSKRFHEPRLGSIGWSVVRYTKRLQIQSPVRAHTQVVGLIPSLERIWNLKKKDLMRQVGLQIFFNEINNQQGLHKIDTWGNSGAVPEDCLLCIFYCEEMQQPLTKNKSERDVTPGRFNLIICLMLVFCNISSRFCSSQLEISYFLSTLLKFLILR